LQVKFYKLTEATGNKKRQLSDKIKSLICYTLQTPAVSYVLSNVRKTVTLLVSKAGFPILTARCFQECSFIETGITLGFAEMKANLHESAFL